MKQLVSEGVAYVATHAAHAAHTREVALRVLILVTLRKIVVSDVELR
jgi:hypothetical protein